MSCPIVPIKELWSLLHMSPISGEAMALVSPEPQCFSLTSSPPQWQPPLDLLAKMVHSLTKVYLCLYPHFIENHLTNDQTNFIITQIIEIPHPSLACYWNRSKPPYTLHQRSHHLKYEIMWNNEFGLWTMTFMYEFSIN